MNVWAMTVAERARVTSALGRDVLRAADALSVQLNHHGQASADQWRAFLQALMDGGGDAMSSPLGFAIQMAILGKIQGETNGNNDTSECRSRKPGGGFQRQFR